MEEDSAVALEEEVEAVTMDSAVDSVATAVALLLQPQLPVLLPMVKVVVEVPKLHRLHLQTPKVVVPATVKSHDKTSYL